MTENRRSIAIVGGGATGVILAAHLMKLSGGQARVSVIESNAEPGRGMAYSTELPEHRLNVAANRMSAHSDDPLHLWNWYREHHPAMPDEPSGFLPRRAYARYLGTLFSDAVASASGTGGLQHVQAECLSISPIGAGLDLRLSNGTSLAAQVAILATGHDQQPHPDRAFAAAGASVPPIDPDTPVAILGSGLSMVDTWLTLEARGHRGTITAISRRGLLPRPHGARRNPIRLDAADIPLGTELSYFVRWFSDLVDETENAGGNWRDVIDGIRPFNQRIWRDWPVSARRRFHRHRIAPDIHDRAQEAMADGRLRLIAGKVADVGHREDGTIDLDIRRRHTDEIVRLEGVRVLDCTGIIRDPSATSNPLISSLVASGVARPDMLRIGLDVTTECALIDADGQPSDRIFAVGPPTRGTFLEIDAVPEIREQCERLAKRLVG